MVAEGPEALPWPPDSENEQEGRRVRIPTIAVLTGPQPVDGDGLLRADLAAIGVTVIEADGPAAAARAVASASAAGRVALVDRRLVAHRHALRLALHDPRWSAAHAPGVLTVSGHARELLATRLRTLPDLTGHRVAGGSPAAKLTAPRPLVPDTLAEQLAEALPLHEVTLPEGLVALLVDAPLTARKTAYAAVAAVDDEAIRLRRAVKSDDGLFTTLFVSSYSRHLARWFARHGLSPNTITTLSLLVAVLGALAAATGTRAGYVGAAVALYLSFVLDCVDGQLARYTLNFSRIGSWLDATFDRVKEYAVYAGLAFGSARHGDDVWVFACLALALQTLRHHIDFAFHEAQRSAPIQYEAQRSAPIQYEAQRSAPTQQEAQRSASAQQEAQRSQAETAAEPSQPPAKSLGYWARKTVILPIGERWALIALLTALTTPRTTFTVLLVWGVLAAAYTTAGRIARSVRSTATRTAEAVDTLYSMSDILARLGAERRRLGGRLGWLIPPSCHALEYAIAIAIASQVHSAPPVAFAYLAALAYHHYDTVYRVRAGAVAPRWLTMAGCFGFEGRIVVLGAVGLVLGGGTHRPLTPTLAVLAVYLWALFLIESVRFWARPAAPALPGDAL
jgi:phosphatidylglycerophosphate synthase